MHIRWNFNWYVIRDQELLEDLLFCGKANNAGYQVYSLSDFLLKVDGVIDDHVLSVAQVDLPQVHVDGSGTFRSLITGLIRQIVELLSAISGSDHMEDSIVAFLDEMLGRHVLLVEYLVPHVSRTVG